MFFIYPGDLNDKEMWYSLESLVCCWCRLRDGSEDQLIVSHPPLYLYSGGGIVGWVWQRCLCPYYKSIAHTKYSTLANRQLQHQFLFPRRTMDQADPRAGQLMARTSKRLVIYNAEICHVHDCIGTCPRRNWILTKYFGQIFCCNHQRQSCLSHYSHGTGLSSLPFHIKVTLKAHKHQM